MCSGKPIYEFVVNEQRMQNVMRVMAEAKKSLSFENVIDLIFELGFGDAVGYDPDNPNDEKLDLQLTDVQIVAVAAAMHAIAESGAVRKLNEHYAGG